MRYLIFCALLVSACGREQPAGPTSEQSAQLNEAEDMLNGVAKEEGPADRSAGPSNSND